MARFINAFGQVLYHPGAVSRLKTNSNAQLSSATTGVVALIGEADGGQPGVVTEVSDPALAKDTFTSGPLADALRLVFGPSNDPQVSSGAFKVLCYKTNASTQASINLPGAVALIADTSTGASTTTVITVTTGALVVDAHIGRWVSTGGERRRIVDNTANTITVTPALSTAPINTQVVNILENQLTITSKDYGLATNQIGVEFEAGATANKYVLTVSKGPTVEQSSEILGNVGMYFQYVGGPVQINGTGVVDAATTSTVTLNTTAAPVLNAFAAMVLELPNGLRRLITGNTAADPTVITLAAGHELTTAEAAEILTGTASVRGITSAVASVTGASGVATGMTTTCVLSPVSTADNLTLTFNANETLRQFADRLASTTNFRVVPGPGINVDTTLMKTFDFGTRATAVDVRFDDGITPATKGTFRKDLQDLVDYINNFSSLVSATRTTGAAAEGDEIPTVTGGIYGTPQDTMVFLQGGTRGTSSNTTFQNGFDAMLQERINHIVPLISEDLTNEGFGSTATFASVAAQFASFMAEANSSARNECGGYMGMEGTKTQLIAQLNQFNSADIQMCGQKISALDVDGNLKVFPEWGLAAQAAGFRAGIFEIGEALTFKSLICSGFTQDSSWNPKNIQDVNDLLGAGLLFIEKVTNGGYRFVRDITSWVNNDSEFFISGGTRDSARYISYNFRKSIEDRFTGPKATVATIASVREFAAAFLSDLRTQNIIVESLDPETESKLLPGWRNLRVFLNGSTLTVRVEVFPCQSISFEVLEVTLLPTKLNA